MYLVSLLKISFAPHIYGYLQSHVQKIAAEVPGRKRILSLAIKYVSKDPRYCGEIPIRLNVP